MTYLDLIGDYSDWLSQIQVTKGQAKEANRERASLLASLTGQGVRVSCSGKKLHVGDLSPGCLACANGRWSCLFLNSDCTADCFFCPQGQSRTISPHANRIDFPDLTAYLDFLELNQMEGVAFSGGEPLLALEKVIAWMQAIRQRFGKEIHIWLYTNGNLLDGSTLRALKLASLDEIRLNISAYQYDLSAAALARQFIGRVSVEIPVIPEDIPILKMCLSKLAKIGVDHLNLHQLYANQHNYRALAQRDYRFLSAALEAPVWESELGALELIQYVQEKQIDLPVHYCSVDYQVTYQDRAVRRMAASKLLNTSEQVTATGHIRRLRARAEGDSLRKLVDSLKTQPELADGWSLNQSVLTIHPSLLALPELAPFRVTLEYLDAELLPAGSPVLDIHDTAKRIELNPSFHLLAGSWLVLEIRDLAPGEVRRRLEAGLGEATGRAEPMARYERIPTGLAPIEPTDGRSAEKVVILNTMPDEGLGQILEICPDSEADLRVGLVSTVYGAGPFLDNWLRHHFELGITHIVLVFDRLEEAAEQASAERIKSMFPPDRLTIWSGQLLVEQDWNALSAGDELADLRQLARTGPSSYGIPARQVLNASMALQAAKTEELGGAPLDWMLHLDHDELFYLQGRSHGGGDLFEHFSAVQSAGFKLVRYLNHELLLPHPLGSPLAFKLNPQLAKAQLGTSRWAELVERLGMSWLDQRPYFNGYVNGKSAVSIPAAASAAGVHSWWLLEPTSESDLCTLADPSVLHLRFTSPAAFAAKYQKMALTWSPPKLALFEPPRAETAALALIQSLREARTDQETIGVELKALCEKLTSFSEDEVQQLRDAGLILTPKLHFRFPPQRPMDRPANSRE